MDKFKNLIVLGPLIYAIYHHFVLKDSTTSNMSKFWTTKY